MLVESRAIAFDLEQKTAKGEMCISPDMESDDWIVVAYECDLITYHQPAEYCDGYLAHGAADICENADNVRYTIAAKNIDADCYDNVQDMIAEYVVQKANFPNTPALFHYSKGAA